MNDIIYTTNDTKVAALDTPSHGNARHEYAVVEVNDPCSPPKPLTLVSFQNGPIKEFGVNGCQNEDLLAIVVDRLEGFQSGTFSCRENAIALTHIQTALMWLNKRTSDRHNRGVEGKSEV